MEISQTGAKDMPAAIREATGTTEMKQEEEKRSGERILAGFDTEGGLLIETHSPEETYALGEALGEAAAPGQVYTLTGDLGVGKTVFAQGFARGLGITGTVNSPTFTILQIYEEGRLPLFHFDVYRIGDVEEMEEIGYEDYFYGEGVCLIEWAELVEEILPENRVGVSVAKNPEKGFDYRQIEICRRSERASNCGRTAENLR